MIIAIDGPAAAGKGTLARMIAAHLGYAYLDTGSLYRAVGLAVLRAGGEPAEATVAAHAAAQLDAALLEDPAIRTEEAGRAASVVAAIPEVRAKLREFQRNFAKYPPDGAPGAVLDGRDIGTVICPEAPIKFFVTASDEERARRRTEELKGRGEPADFEEILADLRNRDARDSSRDISPLKPAQDAHLLDTTDLDIEGAFQAALQIVGEVVGGIVGQEMLDE